MKILFFLLFSTLIFANDLDISFKCGESKYSSTIQNSHADFVVKLNEGDSLQIIPVRDEFVQVFFVCNKEQLFYEQVVSLTDISFKDKANSLSIKVK